MKELREEMIKQAGETMKASMKKVTKCSYEFLINNADREEKKLISKMDEYLIALKNNYNNLNNAQYKEIVQKKCADFDDFCQEVWNKIPCFVPGIMC